MTAAVAIALIASVSSVVVALVNGFFSRAAHKQSTEAIQTNHGKRPGEYLEMVADVKLELGKVGIAVGELHSLMADHTTQDAENFQALRDEIATLKPAS